MLACFQLFPTDDDCARFLLESRRMPICTLSFESRSFVSVGQSHPLQRHKRIILSNTLCTADSAKCGAAAASMPSKN